MIVWTSQEESPRHCCSESQGLSATVTWLAHRVSTQKGYPYCPLTIGSHPWDPSRLCQATPASISHLSCGSFLGGTLKLLDGSERDHDGTLSGELYLCLIAEQLKWYRVWDFEGQQLEVKRCSVKLEVDAQILHAQSRFSLPVTCTAATSLGQHGHFEPPCGSRTLAFGGVLELLPNMGSPLPFRGVNPGSGLESVFPSASTCMTRPCLALQIITWELKSSQAKPAAANARPRQRQNWWPTFNWPMAGPKLTMLLIRMPDSVDRISWYTVKASTPTKVCWMGEAVPGREVYSSLQRPSRRPELVGPCSGQAQISGRLQRMGACCRHRQP